MKDYIEQYPYPRFRNRRRFLRLIVRALLKSLCEINVIGRENMPDAGPLLVVGNHFHFADTASIVYISKWPIEFLGGAHLIDAPDALEWLPDLWGYYRVRRGGASRNAMRAAQAIMAQDGVLTIFPEGGSWANVLRPPRPGTAYIAARTQARILPVGLDGVTEIFPALRQKRRAQVTLRIGKPFGPFRVKGRGRQRRDALDRIGDEIMQRIAALIPPERRGVYSKDPALRAAAREVAEYPYADLARSGPPK